MLLTMCVSSIRNNHLQLTLVAYVILQNALTGLIIIKGVEREEPVDECSQSCHPLYSDYNPVQSVVHISIPLT